MSEKHKVCFKCGESKPLSAFYKHPRMLDGHLNKCKECNISDTKKNRDVKMDYYREYDRQRSRVKGSARHIAKLEYGRNLPVEQRERKNAIMHEYYSIFPERRRSTTKVSNAIKNGLLIRPDYCEHCGKECKPQAHHSSYSEDMWLMVTWLCSSCHGEVHRQYD